VVIECTGIGQLVFDIVQATPPGSITCLTGISSGSRAVPVDGTSLNKKMVLENEVIFGSVNANRRHYEKAADALAKADLAWLGRLVNRRVPLQTGKTRCAVSPTMSSRSSNCRRSEVLSGKTFQPRIARMTRIK